MPLHNAEYYIIGPSSDWVRQYSGHFYGPLSMSAVILMEVDTLSKAAESEKTNNLIDDPDQDVYHCLRE